MLVGARSAWWATLLMILGLGCADPGQAPSATARPTAVAAGPSASPSASPPATSSTVGTDPVAAATAAATSTPSAADADSTSSTSPPPRSAGPRCKAVGAPGPVRLGSHPTRALQLVADDTGVYAIGSKGWGGSHRAVYRVGKDGSGVRVLAELDTNLRFGKIALTPAGVVFTKRHGPKGSARDTLLRVGRDGGAPEVLAEKFGWLAAHYAGNLYGVDYDYWGGAESVVRVAEGGGEVKTLYRRPIGRPVDGAGSFRYTDVAVDGSGIYLADEGTATIARLPLAGGEPSVVVTDAPLPCALHAFGDSLFYGYYLGGPLYRAPKSGGKGAPTDCRDLWAVTAGPDEMWVFGRTQWDIGHLFSLDGAGKTTRKILSKHIFMEAAAVDEECLYYARMDPLNTACIDAIARPDR